MDPHSFFVDLDPDPAVFLNADIDADPALQHCGGTLKLCTKKLPCEEFFSD